MDAKRKTAKFEEADEESLLTPEQKRIIADYRKRNFGFNRNQKPPEKTEVRAEKLSWVARKVPGIQKKIRQFVDGTLLYNPKQHKKS